MRLSPKANDMELVNTEEPKILKSTDVKVKVVYAGVCGGTDIKLKKVDVGGRFDKLKPPVILGHEASGYVVETGTDVKKTKIGDRVVYETTIDPCGSCRYCHSGDWNMCSHRKGLGSSVNGSFADFVVVPERNIRVIPSELSLKTAVLSEPMACAYHIVSERGCIKAGENVIIIGPGIIGLCCALVALFSGANVIVIGTERSKETRLKIAEKFGCYILVNDGHSLKERVQEVFNGEFADLAIDAVGSQNSFNLGLSLVRKMGRVAITGVPSLDTELYTIDMSYIYRNQICITSGRSSTPSSWTGSLKVLQKYHNQLEELVSHVYSPEKWKEAFEATEKKQAIKAVIDFEK